MSKSQEIANYLLEDSTTIPKKKYSEMTSKDVNPKKLTIEDIKYAENKIKGALERLKDM